MLKISVAQVTKIPQSCNLASKENFYLATFDEVSHLPRCFAPRSQFKFSKNNAAEASERRS